MLNPLTHRKVLKKGMPGMATIVEMGVMDRDATSSNMPMTLQVHIGGITPYEVEGQWMVKAKDTVGLSGAILERLAALKDSGALTEKEFEREKKKLLGS